MKRRPTIREEDSEGSARLKDNDDNCAREREACESVCVCVCSLKGRGLEIGEGAPLGMSVLSHFRVLFPAI